MGSIHVIQLGKAYKQYPTRWSRLAEWMIPFAKLRHQLKWVLQDVNFTVNPGEAVGIIGINGAGKSTLLKMITGTTQPTAGRVTSRVGSPRCWNSAWAFIPTSPGARMFSWPGNCWALAWKNCTP